MSIRYQMHIYVSEYVLTLYEDGRDKEVDTHNSYLMSSTRVPVCKLNQQSPKNSVSFPRLKAAPGDRVVAFHTENGHVSLPATSSSKSGVTYWFGTTNQQKVPTLGDVLEWRDAGEEEDGPGQYLGASTYDDGKCAEPNQSPISAQRGVGPRGVGKACKDSGFDIPKGLKPGTIFTVYWVWDFSEHFGLNPNFFEVSLKLFPSKVEGTKDF